MAEKEMAKKVVVKEVDLMVGDEEVDKKGV